MKEKSNIIEREIKPLERTRENIERIVQDLLAENFAPGSPTFYGILEGRLRGYTPKNCPHPGWMKDGIHFVFCTQCGYESMS
jgi:hypothetical protein